MRTESEHLLTIEDAAERLNVSPAYVRRRLIFEKRLPYLKIGRHVRIDPVQLKEFIDRGRVQTQTTIDLPTAPPSWTDRKISWRTSASTR